MSPWVARRWYDVVYWSSFITFTFGWSLRVIGRRNMPESGPVLVIANHQSFFDPVLMGVASRRYLTFMARKTLFNNKFLANLITSLDAFPIDNKGLGKEGLKLTLEALDKNKAVLVFPEGERTHTGQIEPFQPGISLLIKRVKAPIVPIAIAGAYDAFPRTTIIPQPAPLFLKPWAATLAISVGKPIDPKTVVNLGREEMLKCLEDAVKAEWQKAEKLRRK
jgi:1-acyl-sn-glycerol-3-phosphate acyltransferase